MDEMTRSKLRFIFDSAMKMLSPVQQGIVAGMYLDDVLTTRKALMARYRLREHEFNKQHIAALSTLRSILKAYRIETVAHVL